VEVGGLHLKLVRSEKQVKVKRAEGMAQAVECLSSNLKALSLNPCTERKGKKRKEKWPFRKRASSVS
jgi:hypothetical protein